jgi:hypothetical protein
MLPKSTKFAELRVCNNFPFLAMQKRKTFARKCHRWQHRCSLLDTNDIELWSGPRFVIRLNARKKLGAVTHEIEVERMMPKK